MTENDAYRAELEDELAFQRRNLESLQRDKKRLPWLLLVTVASVPAGVLFGWIWFLGLFVGSIVFLITGAYIVAGHTNEYTLKVLALEDELKNLR
ncbi:MAG: hypothetical protein ACF8XB_21515 [Planctomycetota bacterium JB042]